MVQEAVSFRSWGKKAHSISRFFKKSAVLLKAHQMSERAQEKLKLTGSSF
jgi:hypothetical protein